MYPLVPVKTAYMPDGTLVENVGRRPAWVALVEAPQLGASDRQHGNAREYGHTEWRTVRANRNYGAKAPNSRLNLFNPESAPPVSRAAVKR